MWTAAILTGGHARRFGGCSKGALRVGEGTILDRQISVLSAAVDRLLIIATDQQQVWPDGVPVVFDLVPGAGPLGAIYTAIRAAATPHLLIVAGDMPFLSVAFLTHLVAIGNGVDIAIPRTAGGYEPLCATYSGRCVGPLERLLELKRLNVTSLLDDTWELTVRELGTADIVPFGQEEILFFNVNTPADYVRASNIAAAYCSRTG
jgi:molybdenum cofactor guanylyltransferase